jgi:hypothetical protein
MTQPKKIARGLVLSGIVWLAACDAGTSTIGSGDAQLLEAGSSGTGSGGRSGGSARPSGGGVGDAGVVEGGASLGGQSSGAGSDSGAGAATGGGAGNAGMGGALQSECETDTDCPDSGEPCEKCDNGTFACNKAYCDNGTCQQTGDTCPAQCQADEDCPKIGLACTDCGDGSVSCPVTQCVTGKCRTSFTGCHNFDPCLGQPCGARCEQCEDGMCNSFVAAYCSPEGKCLTGLPQCGQDIKCEKLIDCGEPPSNCIACGSTTCAGYRCIDSACVLSCPPYPECDTPQDCPAPTECDKCPDDSCAATTCEAGKCVRLCES